MRPLTVAVIVIALVTAAAGCGVSVPASTAMGVSAIERASVAEHDALQCHDCLPLPGARSWAAPAPAQDLAVATTALRVSSPSINATAALVAADLPSRATRPGALPLRV